MKKNNKSTILLLSILVGCIIIVNNVNNKDSTQTIFLVSTPQSAAQTDGISPNNVTINGTFGDTNVKRGIETVIIEFWNENVTLRQDIDYIANITLFDDTQINVTLVNVNETNIGSSVDDEYYHRGTFDISLSHALGLATVTILLVDEAVHSVVNPLTDYEEYGSFTIQNNLPQIGLIMNSTEVYRGRSINISSIIPSDVEERTLDLEWSIELYRDSGIIVHSRILDHTYQDFSNPDFSCLVEIDIDEDPGNYYINATVWDTETSNSIIYNIIVLNNNPIIADYQFEKDGVIQIVDTISIIRGSSIEVSLNVTDFDYDDESGNNDLLMKIYANEPGTDNSLLGATYNNLEATNEDGSNFTSSIDIKGSVNVGFTELKIRIYEENYGEIYEEITQKILIVNSIPKVSSFNISNLEPTDEKIFLEDDILEFRFNATDAENQIRFIKISLLYHNQTSNTTMYLNYTIEYNGVDTVLSIRAVDLPLGEFIAYAFAIDEQGAISKPITGISFNIDENPSISSSTWLIIIAGFALVGIISFAVGTSYSKSKIGNSNSTPSDSKAKDIASKKQIEDVKKVSDTEEVLDSSDKKNKKKFIRKL